MERENISLSNSFDRSHTVVEFISCVFTLSCQKKHHIHLYKLSYTLTYTFERTESILTIHVFE